MGMYDSVNFTMRCPLCKVEMGDFQSKDAECQLNLKEILEVEVFYSSCDNCNLWISFTVTKEIINSSSVYVIVPSYMDMQAINKDMLDHWTAPEWRRKQDERQELRKNPKFNRRYSDKITRGRKQYGT